jgi:hypothetical protein
MNIKFNNYLFSNMLTFSFSGKILREKEKQKKIINIYFCIISVTIFLCSTYDLSAFMLSFLKPFNGVFNILKQ